MLPAIPGRPAAWRSVYCPGILELFHRPAVIREGSSMPVAVRSKAMPTRPYVPKCPLVNPKVAGNSPVYGPGCKSPLPVAEWAAGKPDCKAPGRKPYFRYSSTLHPDQDRRPCTRNPFPQTRDLPPRLGLRHSHRHRLPRPVPRLVGETRQCHVTDNPRSPQERRHQCPQSRSP